MDMVQVGFRIFSILIDDLSCDQFFHGIPSISEGLTS